MSNRTENLRDLMLLVSSANVVCVITKSRLNKTMLDILNRWSARYVSLPLIDRISTINGFYFKMGSYK